MHSRRALFSIACAILFLGSAFAVDRTLPHAFREYPGIEYRLGTIPLPDDYQEKTEWAFARLMFPGGYNDGYQGRELDWHDGVSLWTQDFPRADRHFSLAVRRLTRIHVRSVEQAINLDDGDDVYNWPWVYAVQVGEWGITDPQAAKLRDYLLRGGFFMADDFHGTNEWQVFQDSMKRVFPTVRLLISPIQILSFIRSMISISAIKSSVASTSKKVISSMVSLLTGAASTMTRTVLWSPLPSTPTSATLGNGPIRPNTPSSFQPLVSASASTTLSTP